MEIKELRDKLGLSQQELAIKLKVAVATVSRWERNLSKPNKTQRKRLDRLNRKAAVK